MNTATAGNLAGAEDKEKEKMEKRRALGRGLASLLPGPRVVPSGSCCSECGSAFVWRACRRPRQRLRRLWRMLPRYLLRQL